MSDKEALKLALEALEGMDILFSPLSRDCTQHNAVDRARKAITAIKQALAAPDLQTELDATNRQVEILCDALAKSRREVAALKAVQEPVAWEDVLGAIARGWTHPENAQKPMDVQLAVAIAKEIQDMYTTPPAAQRQHLTDGSLCWCEPETSYTDPETGASVVVHKGPQ